MTQFFSDPCCYWPQTVTFINQLRSYEIPSFVLFVDREERDERLGVQLRLTIIWQSVMTY